MPLPDLPAAHTKNSCTKAWPVLGLCLLLCSSCLPTGSDEAGTPIARVYDTYLYEKDLDGLVPRGTSAADSTKLVKGYVDGWIKKQLFFTHATKNMQVDEAELNRRLQDYKYQLIVYDYEKRFLENNLDVKIGIEEIGDYYEQNKDNFLLKQNIVKGIMVKVPKEAPGVGQVRQWLLSKDSTQHEKLRAFVYSYADKFYFSDSAWLDFDGAVINTPLRDTYPNAVQALKNHRFLQAQDSSFHYYFRIDDYKITDQVSPLGFVERQIRDIITNRRKIQLKQAHEKEIINNATENEDYEVFPRQ